jgi:PGF-CTERM protein
MKVKGDEQQDWLGFTSGTPGAFGIELGEKGSLLLPVDPASWEETFQEGGEIGATPAEDTPGFTLVVASAAIAMAAFINQRRPETEE